MLLEVILAIIPIVWLIISMAGLKMAGYKSWYWFGYCDR